MTDTTEYVRGNWFRLTAPAGGHPAGTLLVYTDPCCARHDDIYTFVGDDHPGIIRLQPTSEYTRLTDIPSIGAIPRDMVERVVIPDGTPVTVTASNRRSSRYQEGGKQTVAHTEPATGNSLEKFYLGLEWVYPVDFTVDTPEVAAPRPLQVGDRVRYCGHPDYFGTPEAVGNTGVVERINGAPGDDDGTTVVRWDGHESGWSDSSHPSGVYIYNLERIEARTFSVGDSFYIENPSLLTTASGGNVYWQERTEPSRFEVVRTRPNGDEREPTDIYGHLYTPDGAAILATWGGSSNAEQYVSSAFLTVRWDDRPVPETVDKAEHDRIVANLQAEVARLTTWQQQANADASDLNDRLNEEAEDRDWCSDYERILDEVPLRVLEFKGRERTWSGTRDVEVTVTVTQHGTYTGASADLDEDDFEWSEPDTSAIRDAVTNGCYSVTDETDDFSCYED